LAVNISPLFVKNDNSDDRKNLVAINTMQRAYTIIEDSENNRREYVAEFKKTHAFFFPHLKEASTKNLLNAYDHLFFKIGNYDSLETELLKGFLFCKITKDIIVVDYTEFIPVLQSILAPLSSVDGEFGNIISADLELKVNEKIIKLYGTDAAHLRGEIKNNNGEKREIDAPLIIDNYLFIIECKSLSVSEGSIIGTRGAVEFRKNKIKGYLTEVEAKADFIMNNEGRLNKTIPSSVKYIVPVVITSFPEYIWEKTENLFITDDISRVLTINELDIIKSVTSFDKIKNRTFVRKLKNV
jgi:hypothetical protein